MAPLDGDDMDIFLDDENTVTWEDEVRLDSTAPDGLPAPPNAATVECPRSTREQGIGNREQGTGVPHPLPLSIAMERGVGDLATPRSGSALAFPTPAFQGGDRGTWSTALRPSSGGSQRAAIGGPVNPAIRGMG